MIIFLPKVNSKIEMVDRRSSARIIVRTSDRKKSAHLQLKRSRATRLFFIEKDGGLKGLNRQNHPAPAERGKPVVKRSAELFSLVDRR